MQCCVVQYNSLCFITVQFSTLKFRAVMCSEGNARQCYSVPRKTSVTDNVNDGGVCSTAPATSVLLNTNINIIPNCFGFISLKKLSSRLVTVSRGVIWGSPFTGCKVSLLTVSLGISDWLN